MRRLLVGLPRRCVHGWAFVWAMLCVASPTLAQTTEETDAEETAEAKAPDDDDEPAGNQPPTEEEEVPDPSTLDPEQRKKVADRYFERAQGQLEREDWERACANFRISMRFDTSVSTLANIARCEEHAGRLYEAWAANNRARFLNRNTPDEARRNALNQYLTDAIAKLEAQLPSVRVVVPNAPPGLMIKSDGAPMPATGAGEPFPVNPGAHEISVVAPGFKTASRNIEVEPGNRVELVITLEAGEDEVAVVPPPLPTPVPVAPPTQPDRVEGPPVWVWPVGAVGLVALGGAIGLGVD